MLQIFVLVLKGQVLCGNWTAEKWEPPREGSRALAGQTSQPLTPQPLSRSLVSVRKPWPNPVTLTPGCTSAFYTVTSTYTDSHPTCPGRLPEERFQNWSLTNRTKILSVGLFLSHLSFPPPCIPSFTCSSLKAESF